MKTHKEDVVDKEIILSRMNYLNRDSSRIYSEAGKLAEKTDDEIDQLKMEIKQLHKSLATIGQSILNMVRGSDSSSLVFFQVKDEVLSNLDRIKSNMEGIGRILDPQSSFYN